MADAKPRTSAETQRNLFLLHMLQLLLGLGTVQPLFWLDSTRCWQAFLWVSMIGHFCKIRIKHGAPPLLMTEKGAKQWERKTLSNDTQFIILCGRFTGCPIMHLVVIPVWIEALYHAFEYAGSRFGSRRIWQHSGAKLQHILYTYQEEVLTLSALSEIGIGFWLLVKMWYNPWSYVLQVYTYWKCSLPLRYAMPESAVYHKRVWQAAASLARPLLQSSEALRDTLSDVTRWFNIELIPPEQTNR